MIIVVTRFGKRQEINCSGWCETRGRLLRESRMRVLTGGRQCQGWAGGGECWKAGPRVPPSHKVVLFPRRGQLLPALTVGPPFWGPNTLTISTESDIIAIIIIMICRTHSFWKYSSSSSPFGFGYEAKGLASAPCLLGSWSIIVDVLTSFSYTWWEKLTTVPGAPVWTRIVWNTIMSSKIRVILTFWQKSPKLKKKSLKI